MCICVYVCVCGKSRESSFAIESAKFDSGSALMLCLCVFCLFQMGRHKPTEAPGSEQQSGVQAAPTLLHQPAERRCGEPVRGATLRSALPAIRRAASERSETETPSINVTHTPT